MIPLNLTFELDSLEKGDEEIELLAKKGNSLTHCLLLLLETLPRCPMQFKGSSRRATIASSLPKSFNTFDQQQLQNVRDLYQQINKDVSASVGQPVSHAAVAIQNDTPDHEEPDEGLDMSEKDNQKCSGVPIDDIRVALK